MSLIICAGIIIVLLISAVAVVVRTITGRWEEALEVSICLVVLLTLLSLVSPQAKCINGSIQNIQTRWGWAPTPPSRMWTAGAGKPAGAGNYSNLDPASDAGRWHAYIARRDSALYCLQKFATIRTLVRDGDGCLAYVRGIHSDGNGYSGAGKRAVKLSDGRVL